MTTDRPVRETAIEADPRLPTIRITREFDAPVPQVYRAWTEPGLVGQWLGPKDLTTTFDHWDLRTGGSYRYRQLRDGREVASFYGSFHEARPAERLVQTFTYDGVPDGVSLDTVTFEDLGDGRTRVTVLGIVESLAARDMILASGMDRGVTEGYEQLDAVLRTLG
ncbi:SRPBCC family protein [Streptomyces sp. SL13]|uniref:SRPBCC family protein n=1 Tax=Streptantibioticus silvisoli TaxID=2705255 RepID=A0AA90GZ52_9ACTN|nr:SRPBCC family protein [Streptantibioticus silvisoli]MDI5962412.1 SRPBCC family protein [Streptantibioticus silvisoli]MDI5967924.1 SRPBCC family protein [Streptantibioticus silvisoli]